MIWCYDVFLRDTKGCLRVLQGCCNEMLEILRLQGRPGRAGVVGWLGFYESSSGL